MSKEIKKKERFGEYMAEVKGVGQKGKGVTFNLREMEVKHIRRCIRAYSNSHSRDYPDVKKESKWDDLSSRVYLKFLKFGKMKAGIKGDKKKKLIEGLQRKCAEAGCEERDNLTIAHISPRASGTNKDVKENVKLLCPKHHLLFDLRAVRWRKQLEIEKLDKRIEDIEKRNTTDTLGMGVLKDNKFVDFDGD